MANDSANAQDATVEVGSSGDNTIVAAVAGKKIVVVNYLLISSGTVNARWKSGAGTNKSGPLYLIANTGASCADGRWFATAIGEALVLNLNGAVPVGGHLSYRYEPL